MLQGIAVDGLLGGGFGRHCRQQLVFVLAAHVARMVNQ